jgi:hypothetical protein
MRPPPYSSRSRRSTRSSRSACRRLWTPCRRASPSNCGALDASSSVTANRGPDGTPAQGKPSRFQPKPSPPLRRGRPSRNGCNPAPRLRSGSREVHARCGGGAQTGGVHASTAVTRAGGHPWCATPVPPAVPATGSTACGGPIGWVRGRGDGGDASAGAEALSVSRRSL